MFVWPLKSTAHNSFTALNLLYGNKNTLPGKYSRETREVNSSKHMKEEPNLFPRLVNLKIMRQNGYFKVE